MKRIFTFLICSGIFTSTYAQEVKNIGIGTNAPDRSAVLDIQSTEQGLLIPRLSIEQRNAINNPATGLLIFQNDLKESGFYYYSGTEWKPLTTGAVNGISTLDANGWALDGNATTTANKNAATVNSFIGTPAGVPINFKIGSEQVGFFTRTNVFLGGGSGNNISTSIGNIGLGVNTLKNVTTGNYNSAMGYFALEKNTTGLGNVALGYRSLNANTTGSSNMGLGYNSLLSNTSGSYNVALGYASLLSNTTGVYNFGLGYKALNANTIGGSNIAIGQNSLVLNVSGNRNLAIGASSLEKNVIGQENIAIGYNALKNGTSANYNLAIGSYAGQSNQGEKNIFIGYRAGENELESHKLYVSNSNTVTPLIYGDFSARFLSIGNVPVEKRNSVAASGNYSLIVEKGILSEKLKVALKSSNDWADYVFEPGYKAQMLSLEEVEAFTLKNKHLPNVPSADELVQKGLDFNETSRIFMEKIEELTLYLIELNKEVKALKEENKVLKNIKK